MSESAFRSGRRAPIRCFMASKPAFRSVRSALRVPAPGWLRLGCASALATILLGTAGAQAAAAYQSPFTGDQSYVGRTDMGVDVCLSPGDPIRAVGNGVVVGVMRNWFEKQPYIWYQLTSGPDAGRYVYVAEQIRHLAPVGTTLHAGDVVARYAGKGTCIEIGWSAADGATLAQSTTGYTEGQVTVAGVSFARFLISVGVQGSYELVPTKPHAANASKARKKKKAKKPAVPAAPVSSAPAPSGPWRGG